MLDGTTPLGRGVLTLFVGIHLLSGVGSVGRDTALGAWVRELTLPWEKLLGVHQTWPMFAVPPRSTTWLVYTGIRADGEEVPLRPLPGEPSHERVIWLYDRLGKLSRNAVDADREYLRTAVVRHVCAQDPLLVKVSIERHRRMTPAPWTYSLPRGDWPVHVDQESRWNCRRP